MKIARMWRRLIFLFLIAGIPLGDGFGQAPSGSGTADDALHLVINAGGNLSLTTSLAFSPDGKFVIAGSEDKTVRIWNAETGLEAHDPIRGEIGPGQIGAVKAVAMSPDGLRLAVGGSFGPIGTNECGDIRIYDTKTWKLIRRLQGHSDVVLVLRFSPDGSRLLSGSYDHTAIAWDVEAAKSLAVLRGHADAVTAVAWAAKGALLLTGGPSDQARVWQLERDVPVRYLGGHKGGARAIAVSPTDGTIATADSDGTLRLWPADGPTAPVVIKSDWFSIQSLNYADNGLLEVSAWQGLGSNITASSWIFDISNSAVIRTIGQYGGLRGIKASAISSAGDRVAIGGGLWGDGIHIWYPARQRPPTPITSKAHPIWSVKFSRNGEYLAWGTQFSEWTPNHYGPIEFRLSLPTALTHLQLDSVPANTTEAYQAPIERNAQTVLRLGSSDSSADAAIWNRNILNIVAGDKSTPIDLSPPADQLHQQRHQAYTLDQEGALVISAGANGVVRSYDMNGKPNCQYPGASGYVWGVAVSPDNRLLAVGGDDGAAHLFNLHTCKLIASVLRTSDSEFIIWTPQGYYAASPNGDKYVGWQVDRGLDRDADYFSVRQLRRKYYQPQLVERALILGSAESAIDEARKLDPTFVSISLPDLLSRKAPEITVEYPAKDDLRYYGVPSLNTVTDISEMPLNPVVRVEVRINDAKLNENQFRIVKINGLSRLFVQVPLEHEVNTLYVLAENEVGESDARRSIISDHTDKPHRDRLIIISIGIDEYQKISESIVPHLNFASKDAVEFERLARAAFSYEHSGPIESIILTSEAVSLPNSTSTSWRSPTTDGIKKAFELLSGTTSNDTIVFFFSGHGEIAGNNYALLTADSTYDTSSGTFNNTLLWPDVQSVFDRRGVAGRKIVFVDSCRSDGMFNSWLIKSAADRDMFVFGASGPKDLHAYEDPMVMHGIFTESILESLRRIAGSSTAAPEEIFPVVLAGSIADKALQLSKSTQHPVSYYDPLAGYTILGLKQ